MQQTSEIKHNKKSGTRTRDSVNCFRKIGTTYRGGAASAKQNTRSESAESGGRIKYRTCPRMANYVVQPRQVRNKKATHKIALREPQRRNTIALEIFMARHNYQLSVHQ